MKIIFKSFHPPGQCKGCPFDVQRPMFPNIGPRSPMEWLCLLGYRTVDGFECFRDLGSQHIHKGFVMLRLDVPAGRYCINESDQGSPYGRQNVYGNWTKCTFLDVRRDDMHLPIYSRCDLYNCSITQEGKLHLPIKAPACLAQAMFKGSNKEEP